MTSRPGRSIALGGLLLALALLLFAPAVAGWWRTHGRLPAGYGAEGDRRRAVPMPGPVRAAVESLASRGRRCWVKERATHGGWAYELHAEAAGRPRVIRLTPAGVVMRPDPPAPRSEAHHACRPRRPPRGDRLAAAPTVPSGTGPRDRAAPRASGPPAPRAQTAAR